MSKEQKGLAANLKEAVSKSRVKTKDGKGITNNASVYQKGSPFQEAQSKRFQGFAGENINREENKASNSFFSGGVVGKIRDRMKKGKK